MKDFIAEAHAPILASAGLDDFEALWSLSLPPVDSANQRGSGSSFVCRLQLGDRGYYLKRQQGYLTHSLRHPFGESLCAREWRNIQRFERLRIAALTAAFFGRRGLGSKQRALLLTKALDDFSDLTAYLALWQNMPTAKREAIVCCCGELAKNLHGSGQKHGCLYPKHIFLRQNESGWQSCLIDLEKARPLLPLQRDRISDLEPLLRRAEQWADEEQRLFLRSYLPEGEALEPWLDRLSARRQRKQGA